MSEQDNSLRAEESEATASGLLLSVEPVEGGEKYYAQKGDGTDTDTDLADTSDATDSDGTDTSDTDGTDAAEGDGTDGTDGSLSADTDGTDDSSDSDGTDAS
jgi:hypothetical protein